MTKCKKCGVEIGDKTKVCPMCDMVLSGDDSDNTNIYPNIRQKTRILKRLINIVTYFSIVLGIMLIVINYYNYNGVKWSFITGAAIVYFILTLQYTANKRNGHIKKIFVQMVGALLLILLIDYGLGYSGWSVNIGIPCGILALNVIIIVCMIVNKENWQSYLLMQIFTLLLSILQMIFYFTGVVKSPVLPWICFGISAVMFTSSIVIGDKKAKNELKRRFYI